MPESERLRALWRDAGLDDQVPDPSARTAAAAILEQIGMPDEHVLHIATDIVTNGPDIGLAAWTALSVADSFPTGVTEKTLDLILQYSSTWVDFVMAHWSTTIDEWTDPADLLRDVLAQAMGVPRELFDLSSTILDAGSDALDAIGDAHAFVEALLNGAELIGDAVDATLAAGIPILVGVGAGKLLDSFAEDNLAPARAKLQTLARSVAIRRRVIEALKRGLPAPVIASELRKLDDNIVGI